MTDRQAKEWNTGGIVHERNYYGGSLGDGIAWRLFNRANVIPVKLVVEGEESLIKRMLFKIHECKI